jgi:hypothetical protein
MRGREVCAQTMDRRYLSLVALLLLSACATPGPDISVTGIDATTMRLTAREGAYPNIDALRNAVLLRAAEETLAHGRMSFRVVDPASATRTERFWAVKRRSLRAIAYEPDPGEILIRMMSGPKQENSSADVLDAIKVICSLKPSPKCGPSAR